MGTFGGGSTARIDTFSMRSDRAAVVAVAPPRGAGNLDLGWLDSTSHIHTIYIAVRVHNIFDLF